MASSGGSWSRNEVVLTVSAYFDMLEFEQQGVKYNKSKRRRELAQQLSERTESSIEWKFQNISAVLFKYKYPYIIGYKPKHNYQVMLEQVVLDLLSKRSAYSHLLIKKIYPLKSFSWELLSPDVALKRMDKSSFLHNGAAIPKDISFFFDDNHIVEPKQITLVYDSVKYLATLIPGTIDQRVRLFWHDDFSKVISTTLPVYFKSYLKNGTCSGISPEIRFVRKAQSKTDFDVEFIDCKKIVDNFSSNDDLVSFPKTYQDGATKEKIAKYYERDPRNRLAAIRIHGCKCIVCGFDFNKFYGELGIGYIEVHHLTPLSEINKEHDINPSTDLVPICPNCHRMIHRNPGKTLGIQELASIIFEINQTKTK